MKFKFNKEELGRFFSLRAVTEGAQENRYAAMSRLYRWLGHILLTVLILFLTLSVIFGYKEFTYQNIYFFIKDLDSTFETGSHSGDMINYGYEDNRVYAAYKGGVAVAGKYTVAVYSAGGRKTSVYTTGYASPSICSSSKYLMVYDAKSGEYSVYNSFIRLDGRSLRSEIYGADINDNGEILIHTADTSGAPLMYLYDSEGELAARYPCEKLLVCSDLSDDGKYIASAEVESEGGELAFSFNLYRRRETTAAFRYEGRGELPLVCEIAGDKCFLITSKCIRILDMKGKLLSELAIEDGESFKQYSFDKNGIAATAFNGSNYRIIYLSALDGDTSSNSVDFIPSNIAVAGDTVYIGGEREILEYNTDSDEFTRIECDDVVEDILVSSSKQAYVCYSSYATRLK